jgi:hypothetical protein
VAKAEASLKKNKAAWDLKAKLERPIKIREEVIRQYELCGMADDEDFLEEIIKVRMAEDEKEYEDD